MTLPTITPNIATTLILPVGMFLLAVFGGRLIGSASRLLRGAPGDRQRSLRAQHQLYLSRRAAMLFDLAGVLATLGAIARTIALISE